MSKRIRWLIVTGCIVYWSGMQLISEKMIGVRLLAVFCVSTALVACAELEALQARAIQSEPQKPAPQSKSEIPLSSQTSAADLDNATASEKTQASRAGSGQILGQTIASLGTPSEPGFWLKTPLVKKESAGVVSSTATGQRIAVTLIPIDGPATAGSRISLSAMRLLDIPLTELAELEVTLGG